MFKLFIGIIVGLGLAVYKPNILPMAASAFQQAKSVLNQNIPDVQQHIAVDPQVVKKLLKHSAPHSDQ